MTASGVHVLYALVSAGVRTPVSEMRAACTSPLVVTRHKGLVDYLVEVGLAPKGVEVLEHATEGQVAGRVVIGVLPMRLAAAALAVVEVPLDLAPEDRGRDLPVERVREIAGAPRIYTVRCVGELELGLKGEEG